MSLISTENLGMRFGGFEVLHGINFNISAGEIVTLVGPNGSGKTTFLKALIGAQTPSSGTVSRSDGLSIGYVPQRLQLDGTHGEPPAHRAEASS